MVFNSYLFWVFFALVLVLYRALGARGAAGHTAQNWLLLVASYTFYGAWDWRFLGLIWFSTLLDYTVGLRIHGAKSAAARRAWLGVSMTGNLGLLGFFKYYDFFARELGQLLGLFGIDAPLPLLGIVLPVGISFYTFQSLSYAIDVYRRDTEPCRDPLAFSVYVCFFPQLVAGPIERFTALIPQIKATRNTTRADFQEGLYHVLIGLFKKVVIADNLAPVANQAFGTPASELTGPLALVGVYAFALQVYGDFSGYSSIAQGVAKWLGFDLMFNFRMPYFATSPSDFWRRWHISLSQWLRDYLYFPLGGNRGGAALTYRNLLLTMTIGGVWHGAAMTYVVWGVLHGLILCLYRPLERWIPGAVSGRPLTRLVATLVMFHLVCLSWLFFRAETLTHAVTMAHGIATDAAGWSSLAGDSTAAQLVRSGLGLMAFFALPLLLYEAWVERRGEMLAVLRVAWPWRAALYAYFVLMMLYFAPPLPSVFIYFQF
ncbi:MAG: MBOAT family O-acyltransferase [Lacipirellulaceae bacterium]